MSNVLVTGANRGIGAATLAKPPPPVIQRAAGQSATGLKETATDLVWPALRRLADRLDPDYAT